MCPSRVVDATRSAVRRRKFPIALGDPGPSCVTGLHLRVARAGRIVGMKFIFVSPNLRREEASSRHRKSSNHRFATMRAMMYLDCCNCWMRATCCGCRRNSLSSRRFSAGPAEFDCILTTYLTYITRELSPSILSEFSQNAGSTHIDNDCSAVEKPCDSGEAARR